MGDVSDLANKLGITSPRVSRKAKELCQLLDIRSSSGSLSALNLTGSCKTVTCLELAASSFNQPIDRSHAARLSGSTKKQYTMTLKAIESVLELDNSQTIRDLAVQFGCTGAVTLAQQLLKKYEEDFQQRGIMDTDFSSNLFRAAALCSACKQQKIKIDRPKIKELCSVKKTCFDTLAADFDTIAGKLKENNNTLGNRKRGSTLIDQVESLLQDDSSESKSRRMEDESASKEQTDYLAWKRKILENAAKANS